MDPGGEQILIGDEVAEALLCARFTGALIICLLIYILTDAVRVVITLVEPLLLLIGQILIKDKTEDIVLIFIRLDLRTHTVCGFPYFGSQLLFIHDVFPFRFLHSHSSHPFSYDHECIPQQVRSVPLFHVESVRVLHR